MMTAVPFEIFDRRTAATQGVPHVSIQKNGVIRLDRSAYVALDEPEGVELLFDREREIVGIRAADPAADHAYVVREHSRGSSFLISGKSFAAHYDIDTDQSRRWVAWKDGDILCISLQDDPVT
jgi:hypothetical protein